MATKLITIAAATKAAKEAHAAHQRMPRSNMAHHAFVALRGTGYDIKAGAYADGDNCRTVTNLAKWIRRNAVAE